MNDHINKIQTIFKPFRDVWNTTFHQLQAADPAQPRFILYITAVLGGFLRRIRTPRLPGTGMDSFGVLSARDLAQEGTSVDIGGGSRSCW